jgi:hypothetical protein
MAAMNDVTFWIWIVGGGEFHASGVGIADLEAAITE